ncbi:ABC transporter substrate-binding protein [Brachybacterium sp. ACRRE]|uniref:ABC transporter substrate-binding protein n=1 Tax=Brachybacterium sp. ACRRE TaxID=2918184 RepID=UPI001EF39B9E|nr:ABC transporter substrate-binding protein [Brachybacterium sp. ACRRE]MCG7308147.1 ABC transporter substrate-binding protein [Brachybacterium sp. ACRRE]
MRRRGFLALTVPGLLALASCSSAESDSASTASDGGGASGSGAFSYEPEGYDGLTVELDEKPQKIVADIYSAAALQPFGITFAGVFGYGKGAGGQGDLDLEKENIIGLDAEFSLEKLAAATPDIVIGVGNAKGDGWTWWDEKVTTQVAEVAPFLPVRMSGTPQEMIDRYTGIAKALGADVDTAEQKQAKKDFDTAVERVSTVAEEKKDWLTVMALNIAGDDIYTSDTLGVTTMLADLGLKLVGPEAPEDSAWATSTWEKISDYDADVILLAETSTGYEENPLWTSLPAVEADQVGSWDDKRAYSYTVQTAWLNDLAEVLEKAEDVVK